jgi:hypothetical protein
MPVAWWLVTNDKISSSHNHKWYVSIGVTIHAMWIFLRLLVFFHLSKAIIEFVVACVNYD